MKNQRVVVITGGTRGLGLATAKAFAEEGARLILTFRSDKENALKVCSDFKKRSVECRTFAIDFTDSEAPERFIECVKSVTQDISVYVHNAAATAFKPLLEVKNHHLQKTFDISVFSFIRNVQYLVPLMRSGGSIVTVSGMDTQAAVPFHGVLGAAKASLELLTRYFADELASKNIRVNGVNPGFIPTDSTRRYLGSHFDKISLKIAALTPSRRLTDLNEVASVIQFLASPRASWVVGQIIVVDGGWGFACPGIPSLDPKEQGG